MLKYEKKFVGRKEELQELSRYLEDEKVRVICLHGETGVGKTAIANVFVENCESKRFLSKEKHSAFRHGLMVSPLNNGSDELLDWFVSSLALKIVDDASRNATRHELVVGILDKISKFNTLLLLDNVEDLDKVWLSKFVSSWLDTSGSSLLLLTTIEPNAFSSISDSGFVNCHIVGFKDDDEESILTLLGGDLRSRLDKEILLETSRKLKNHPQKLLYLRWLDPEASGIDNLVKAIQEQKELELDKILQRIDGPLTHFFALGRNRTIEIDEKLFAWLWDNLGNGLASIYIDVRNQLIRDGILTNLGNDEERGFRINPGIHIQLEKNLEKIVGTNLIHHIDYFLSEYYRHCFIYSNVKYDMIILGSYVYHATRSGNLFGALDFVLNSDIVKSVHKQGYAFGMRVVLQTFDSFIVNRVSEIENEINDLNEKYPNEIVQLEKEINDIKRKRVKVKIELSHCLKVINDLKEKYSKEILRLEKEINKIKRYHTKVKIELAHCHKDLSNHDKCLHCLDEAESLVTAFSDESTEIQLLQAINYFRGISYSSLGLPDDCIKAYLFVVTSGLEEERRNNEWVILALGYLAFELRFYDSSKAIKFGEYAVNLAKQYKRTSLISKNLCSLGQSLFFSNEIDNASNCFDEAEKILVDATVGGTDQREIGRIQINRAMVKITKKQYDEAIELLSRARNINELNGDRRRLATANGLIGIALWKNGREKEGKNKLISAIKQHHKLKDWRNLINEVLSYAYMIEKHSVSKAIEDAKKEEHSSEPWAMALKDAKAYYSISIFEDYWASYYRPRLLE